MTSCKAEDILYGDHKVSTHGDADPHALIEDLRQYANTVNATNVDLKNQINDMQLNIGKLNDEIFNLEERAEINKDQLSKLTFRLEEAQKEAADYWDQYYDSVVEIQGLLIDIEILKSDNKAQVKKIKDLRAMAKKLWTQDDNYGIAANPAFKDKFKQDIEKAKW